MIDRDHDLPIAKQAAVLGISRGSVYYLPRPVSETDLAIMRRLVTGTVAEWQQPTRITFNPRKSGTIRLRNPELCGNLRTLTFESGTFP